MYAAGIMAAAGAYRGVVTTPQLVGRTWRPWRLTALAVVTTALIATQQILASRPTAAVGVGGLPEGLAWQVGYCLVAAAWLAVLVRWAWPHLPGEVAVAGLTSTSPAAGRRSSANVGTVE